MSDFLQDFEVYAYTDRQLAVKNKKGISCKTGSIGLKYFSVMAMEVHVCTWLRENIKCRAVYKDYVCIQAGKEWIQ